MGRAERLNRERRIMLLSESPKDARGRALQEGDEIILAIRGPIYFRVAQITPILDLKAPPGLQHLHLGCMLTFTVKAGTVHPEFVRVQTAAEAGPSAFRLLDAQPAGGEGGAP
jgi:hypothetical protein